MREDFIKEQAKRFAKIVNHSASKFDNLNELTKRLETELQPYVGRNRTVFIVCWKEELDKLFYDHLKKCDKTSDCPQHKTSKNSDFIVEQFNSINGNKKSEASMLNTSPYFDQNDLNYYFNAKNIPNQDLIFETYNYFQKGEGQTYFDALDFLNLINWHYQFIRENVEKPFDVLAQIRSLSFSKTQTHVLVAFILKWYGGYPVNNLNTQYNTTLKFIESEYITEINETRAKLQDIIDMGLSGQSISSEKEIEQKELEKYLRFLNNLDSVINNAEQTQRIRGIEKQINNSLNLVSNENVIQAKDKLFVFVSHSSKDEEVVKLFVDKILQLALQINLKNIFCTSIQAASITSGENFRTVIKENLIRSSHVIQIITHNYKESEVCLNEMGAAWVLNHKVIPFILSPVTYDSVGFIHHPDQLLKLNNADDLFKFIDEMKLSDRILAHSEVNRHIEEFLMGIKK